jgi:hypothetical protein
MLHKDYDRKGSVEEKFLVVGLKGLELGLNGSKSPVLKYLNLTLTSS